MINDKNIELDLEESDPPPIQLNELQYQWISFDLSKIKEINYIKTLQSKGIKIPTSVDQDLPKISQHHKLNDTADDIMFRYLKFGQLDVSQRIAKKTGALKRDSNNDKDINYYDQEDEFIDDAEFQDQQNPQKMVLPEPQYNDFKCHKGDLSALIQSQTYIDRIGLINQMTKNDNLQQSQSKEDVKDQKPMRKSFKKIKSNSGKAIQQFQAQAISNQDSQFLENLIKSLSHNKKDQKPNHLYTLLKQSQQNSSNQQNAIKQVIEIDDN